MDGGRYMGGWAGGRREGHGRMEYAEGMWFEGVWANDKPARGRGRRLGPLPAADQRGRHASATCTSTPQAPAPDGSPPARWIYEGNLDGDVREGKGSCLWDDGAVYVGDWHLVPDPPTLLFPTLLLPAYSRPHETRTTCVAGIRKL